jgi:undecaprenyl-diphosphatase
MFSVFKNINRFANKSKLLDGFAVFCARYLLYVLLIFLLASAVIIGNWRIFIYPFLSGLFSAFVITKIIYFFYKEERPAELMSSKVLIPVPKNPSFPSRHAALLFGISFCLFLYSIPLAIIFIVSSCLVGTARVFCGVHWYHDILAGILTGFSSALILAGLINYINL